jgi:hypothetical protein
MGFGTKQTSPQVKQSDAQSKQSHNYKSATGGPVGIGGWLIFPTIGFLFVIISFSPTFFSALIDLSKIIGVFFKKSKDLDVYLSSLLVSICFFFVTISAYICLYKIFFSRRALRKIAVAHFLTAAVANAGFYWFSKVHTVASMISGTEPEFEKIPVMGLLVAAVWVCIWCAYFIFSKRVENTFEKKR